MFSGSNQHHNSSLELSGGAIISDIFHNRYKNRLEKVDCLDGLAQEDIYTAIRNATGLRSSFFVPSEAFEVLVKRQISLLEEPSLIILDDQQSLLLIFFPGLRCVEIVYEELERLMHACAQQVRTSASRFLPCSMYFPGAESVP